MRLGDFVSNPGQPIEALKLSGLFVASLIRGQPEQRPKRIRGVTRRSTSETDGIERSKNQVAQQARIRFTSQNACTLCIPDKLGPPGHIAAPQSARGCTGRITGKGRGEYGDVVVAQFMHGGGMREPRRSIGSIVRPVN
jgi:hypothetical protein